MTDSSIDFSFAGAQVPSRAFKAGQIIFSESERGNELFVIQSGKVELRLGNRVLESLDANGIFRRDGADRQSAAQMRTPP